MVQAASNSKIQTFSKQHSIRCTKDGRWTEEFQMCKNIEGDCLPPPDINLVENFCGEGFSIGQYAFINAVKHAAPSFPSRFNLDRIKHSP